MTVMRVAKSTPPEEEPGEWQFTAIIYGYLSTIVGNMPASLDAT